MPRSTVLAVVVLGSFLAACGDAAPPAGSSASAKPVVTSPPLKPTSSAKLDEMPPLTVDELGPYLNGQRPKLKDPGGPELLKKIVSELPIKSKEVELIVLPKSKSTDVVAVVRELGAAGAPTVKIKVGSTRNDLPKELVVVPRSQFTDTAPPCSVVAIVTDKLDTDVWNVQGTSAKRHRKGLAGPDISHAMENLQKDLKGCDSKVAFFTVDESLGWELSHMIGGAIRVSDSEKHLEKLVLLDEVPVPGKPLKGFSGK